MADTPSKHRYYQFRLRHLLFATTAVAVFFGVGVWLGWQAVLLVTLCLIAPAGTLIHLTSTAGKQPHTSLLLGALLQASVFGLLGVVSEISLLAIGSPLAEPGMWGFLLTPFCYLTLGVYSGVILCALAYVFWYFFHEVCRLFRARRRD